MTDAMAIFQATRPQPPAPSEDIRAPSSNRSRELHELAMNPGSPGYRARIPPPPCYACGEDHFPTRTYDHAWQPEPLPIHDEPVSASAIVRRPQLIEQQVDVSARRVALYVGRGETYVVAVEAAPEWDAVISFKVQPEQVLPLVALARALEVKVADKTGGDLVMLEQEDASQHAQTHARGAAAARGDSPRRPGPAADRPQEGELEVEPSTDGGVPGERGERRGPARRYQR
jgi:hypothetical protein